MDTTLLYGDRRGGPIEEGFTVNKFSRVLVLGAGLVISVTTACSSGSEQAQPGAVMPETADFVVDMPESDGSMITMALAVKGEKVIGYATNGTDTQAYLFGTQKDGKVNLTSDDGDSLTASFDGDSVTGELKLADAAPLTFDAPEAKSPAGMYTATVDGERASWVVRKDRSTVGMMDRLCPVPLFQDSIGSCGDNRRASDKQRPRPAPQMTVDTMSANMDGTPMKPKKVTGDMSDSPASP